MKKLITTITQNPVEILVAVLVIAIAGLIAWAAVSIAIYFSNESYAKRVCHNQGYVDYMIGNGDIVCFNKLDTEYIIVRPE